ncbi:hypothetical protein [Holdemania filiformis]|uniref:hypothetical protein n=1 Tax=Holdemania filiformis TaxID=61171 RepID=UPI003A958505
MKAAYTREIINPILPCKMEGYNEARFCFNQTAQQKQVSGEGLRTACGLRDDLLLDTLILQAGETMVFFTLDIAIAEQQFTDACRKAVSEACGLDVSHICVSCSHTHNSPVVSHGMNGELDPDLEYWERIQDKMIYSAKWALRHLREAQATLDQVTINGFYNNRNRPGEEYNDRCEILTLRTADGLPLVQLLNLACHPTILGAQNLYITADFFGVLRRSVQGATGMPVMIFNGEAGDVSPRLMKKGVDWNECLRYGEGIAAQLIDPKHPRPLTVENLNVRSVKMTIDYNPQTRLHYEPECLIVDFGSFRIVTVPCEIDTVLGKRIREYDGKPTLLCAYANGFHYYAVNKQEYGIVFESFNTYFPYGAADEMVDLILAQLQA